MFVHPVNISDDLNVNIWIHCWLCHPFKFKRKIIWPPPYYLSYAGHNNYLL